MTCRTYLRLDIKETSPARLLDVGYGHEASAIGVAGELCMFDEGGLGDEVLELFLGDEMVVLAVGLACAR